MECNTELDTECNTLALTLQNAPFWLSNFVVVYQKLSKDSLELLSEIYHDKVTFIDPIHQVEGYDNLYQYFKNLYQNLSSCDFVIDGVIWQDSQASLFWTMTYQHPKLNKGKPVVVLGTSHIKGADDKVIYHRDYLDLGAMLYEQLPILGKITKWIKTKAAN
ncbi:nuclear transport factor 2 family protein [Colwellia sp. 12G3]|uniref:nuclear transport factor 2 family protein n=1 Tax=Colwellia sp. 12G3 TaxID=2058299 RepID=UPI000C329D1E|nr:nuclear transport factor 2 family protein [Colwellia sp. 12G3]PKI14845.1 transcriptional regulator [Colwellia sp. 12G3]